MILNKLKIILFLTLFLSVTPATAVQIEESNTGMCNSIQYIENYKVNMEDSVAVYSFKNNTTSMGNGSGGLAPLETPKAEEGFSTGEKWVIEYS